MTNLLDPGTAACHCDGIRQWAQTSGISTDRCIWDGLSRQAQLLRSNKHAKWTLSARQLRVSARADCQTCILFAKAIKVLGLNFAHIKAIHLQLSSLVPQLRITVEGAHRHRGATWEFYLSHPDGYQGYEPFGPGLLRPPQQPRPACLASNTDQAIHTIRKWILDCLQAHRACKSGGFVPRRLLHVGNLTGNHSDMTTDAIHLVEARRTLTEPFIALSHCWGKTQHPITTKANYRQRLALIPLCELSKTFQDAVWLTRRLGVKYLWIDSLCIVQDDIDDWEHEAVDMFPLYASAYITIAASHGADGEAGILYERPTGKYHSNLDVELRAPGDVEVKPTTVTLTPQLRLREKSRVHRLYGSVDERGRPSSKEPLLGRGWAFQERALSTRIVHFTREELLWECKQSRHCGCGFVKGPSFVTSLMGSLCRKRRHPEDDDSEWEEDIDDQMESSNDGESISGTSIRPDEKQVFPPGLEKFYKSEAVWWRFVESYTTRQLTKATDRGPAFAGIAQSFGKIMLDFDDEPLGRYCAGLWQSHLPSSLLWSCSADNLVRSPTGTTTARRTKDSMAPSWSWYSVSGPCRFLGEKYSKGRLTLEPVRDPEDFEASYEFDAVTGTPFGRLRRGAINLEGMAVVLAARSSTSKAFRPRAVQPGKTL